MPSNALSHRRTFLRRPIVCKPPPPTPPGPGPSVNCSIASNETSLEAGLDCEVYQQADHGGFDEETEVSCVCSATGGEYICEETIYNGVLAQGRYTAPDEPGVYTLKSVFQWPDSAICISLTEVEVTPGDEE